MLQQPLSPLNRIAYPTDPNGLEGQPTTLLTALCQSQCLEIHVSMVDCLAHASDGEVLDLIVDCKAIITLNGEPTSHQNLIILHFRNTARTCLSSFLFYPV